jgi:hypothetical protein
MGEGSVSTVQLVPPLEETSIVPSNPTATQRVVEGQVTEVRLKEVTGVICDQVCPPLVDTSLIPSLPTIVHFDVVEQAMALGTKGAVTVTVTDVFDDAYAESPVPLYTTPTVAEPSTSNEAVTVATPELFVTAAWATPPGVTKVTARPAAAVPPELVSLALSVAGEYSGTDAVPVHLSFDEASEAPTEKFTDPVDEAAKPELPLKAALTVAAPA